MSRPADKVVVRVEVEVPGCGCAEAHPGVLGNLGKKLTFDTNPVSISLPTGGRALVRGTAGSGSICARGTAVLNGTAARTVFAKIYPGTLLAPGSGAGSVPDQTPFSAAPMPLSVAPSATGNWEFSQQVSPFREIPGARGNPPAGAADNTLCVWAIFDNDACFHSQVAHFNGQVGPVTDCDPGSGRGSGSGMAPAVAFGMASHPARLHGTVREKSGLCASWPDNIIFAQSGQGFWAATPAIAGCPLTLVPHGESFFLACALLEHVVISPRSTCCHPPHHEFAVVIPGAKSGAAGRCVLHVTQ